jgi:hypothetical protein
MKQRALGLVLALACLGAMAPSAHAGWRINRAVAVANVVWHNPCPLSIQWAKAPVDDSSSAVAGEPMAWASLQDGCRLQGLGVVYMNINEPVRTFDVFCSRVLHEVGHLAGAVHSSNPRSVMYLFDESQELRVWSPRRHRFDWRGFGDPRCRDRGRPYLEAHGVLAPRA